MDAKLDSSPLTETIFSRLTSLSIPRWLWLPLLLFVVTRLGVLIVAYLAVPAPLGTTQ